MSAKTLEKGSRDAVSSLFGRNCSSRR